MPLQQTKLQEKSTDTKSCNLITTINIEKIPAYTSIGIHEEEKKMGQKLLVDVSVEINSEDIYKDSINNTFSYTEIYKIVQEICKRKSYNLIENLAEEIAKELLNQNLVLKATIKVHKPHIPFPNFQGNVSVEVTRKKERS